MKLKELVGEALKEDLPKGDVTTDPLGCDKIRGHARVTAKQDLVLSGTQAFTEVFAQIDSKIGIHWKAKDGDKISKGYVVCELEGSLASLLKGERTALNFMGHLCGIATLTSRFVAKTRGTKTKIVDTRKTMPLLRELEKAAVRHGGGENHRFNLSDRVLIKENHIRAAGGITHAVAKIRKNHPEAFIEVEITNHLELSEALNMGVNEVLLDNMSLDETAQAVKFVAGRCQIEASGNMTLDRIETVARLGVDFISVGQLTHSAPCADLSMQFDRQSP